MNKDGGAIVAANGGSYRASRQATGSGALVPAGSIGGKGGIEPTVPKEVRMPKEVKNHDRVARREEARQDNLSECRSMCAFFLFLFVFTFAMLLDQTASSSRLADHIRIKMSSGPVKLEAVTNVDDLYSYLRQVVVPVLYENSSDTRMALELSPYYHPIDVTNRMVGGVRLRQVKVKYMSDCQLTPMFSEFTISCYPVVTPETQSTEAFGPESKFTYSTDRMGTSYVGYLGSYSPDGFMEVLPRDVNEAFAKLEELQDGDFLGPWTRALFIDFLVWNSNVGTYAITTVNVEFGASGGVASYVAILTMSPRHLSAGGLGSSSDQAALAVIIILMVFVFYFIYEEGKEVNSSGAVYFLDPWNVLDWTNLLLLVAAFGIRMYCFIEASGLDIGRGALNNPDGYQSVRSLAQLIEMVKLLNSLNAVILWGKVTKYLRHMPITRELIGIVWKALDLFVPFLCMFAVAFFGFAMSYNIGFGDKIWELSTFGSTLSYLFRAFLRDIKLMPAYDITPMFGAVLILIFYVTFLLVGVNVLFAIITDAMFRAKMDQDKKKDDDKGLHEEEPVEEFVREIRRRTKKFIKRRFPKLYKTLYRRRKAKAKEQVEDEDEELDGKAEMIFGESSSDEESVNDFSQNPKLPSREDLMMAIEHMSGRILSEVSIVGIEIKSELHDVCERVAQMQMAVEELSMRTDGVRLDQEEFLAASG